MYGALSRAFRRDKAADTLEGRSLNGGSLRDLTGKVRVDKKEQEFSGGYSFVYKGLYKRQVVASSLYHVQRRLI